MNIFRLTRKFAVSELKDWNKDVLQSSNPVIVDFFATYVFIIFIKKDGVVHAKDYTRSQKRKFRNIKIQILLKSILIKIMLQQSRIISKLFQLFICISKEKKLMSFKEFQTLRDQKSFLNQYQNNEEIYFVEIFSIIK